MLRLRFWHGYNATEIGKALGLTPGNVRIVQMRALQRAAALQAAENAGPGWTESQHQQKGEYGHE